MRQTAIKESPQSPRAIRTIKSAIMSSKALLKADAILVLACGRKPNKSSPGGRDLILSYAKKHLKEFQFFIAEKVFELFVDKDINVLKLEEILLKYCDCVIVVLESQSTFAELGAFAIKKELAKNLLVINDVEFKASQSFISQGPLAEINKVSQFKPVIHIDLKSILRVAPELSKRLSKIKKLKNKTISLRNIDEFNAEPKAKMLFLLDMITFFQPIRRIEIIRILTTYFGDEMLDIDIELNLLIALGLTTRIDGYYIRPMNNQRLYFVYRSLNEILVRSDIVNHYHKYSRERVTILSHEARDIK